MRILLVSSHGTDAGFGGAERYVRDLAQGLGDRGHEVTVLSAFPARAANQGGPETIVLHASDWREDRVRRLRNHAGDLASEPWPRYARLLRELRPQLVHTSNLPGIGSGIWESARRAGIPVVHTLHDYHLLCPRTDLLRRDGTPCRPNPLLCGLRTRRLLRWREAVDVLISGSRFLHQIHSDSFGSTEHRLIRLPVTAADPMPPRPALDRPRTLGYLGALTRVKGVELLAAAVPALADGGFELRVAGDGPLAEFAAEAFGDRYAGRVEGVAKDEFIARCDIGLVPSLWDEPSGPPYVVCEWLGAGRPVISTARGGLGEVAAETGVVTFDGTAAGLEVLTAELADGGSSWQRLLATVPDVGGDTDLARWLNEHEDAYAAALGNRRGQL
jgi:glycosyltransferase involved in cell wall biosynthesis